MRKAILMVAAGAAMLAAGFSVYAQVKRPYRNGTVWEMSFIKVKPGMEAAYLSFIATEWKKEQEALRKEGVVLSYKVLETEAHSADDWNLVLMTEFKDLATMEASEDKADAIAQKLIGDDEKQRQGYKERLALREIAGNRIAREIVLEPKGATKLGYLQEGK
jgi:hypothetical protein